MKIRAPLLLALLVFAVAARADEIRLKDGSKIIGTIVGFEDGSFKVQTSYGFAMVRKDQIVEIIPSIPKQPPAQKPKESPAAPKDQESPTAAPGSAQPAPAVAPAASLAPPGSGPDAVSAPAPHLTSEPSSAAPAVAPSTSAPPASHTAPAKPAARPAASVSAIRHSPGPAGSSAPAAPPASSTAASAAPTSTETVSAPAPESKPEPIREEIVGNLYINRTYGFDIYKPPDWTLLPDEMHSLPSAVAAMGTDDSTTLLLIGREAQKGTLEAQAAATDAQLHDIYDNFRLLASTHTNIAGEPAIERHFRGSAADRDWSVTVVTVAHGKDLFTVLGMTYADTDLIQIQENVIARAITSLRFETP